MPPGANRPNIVFIECDSMDGRAMEHRQSYRMSTYEPQLFNLADDPWEVQNMVSARPDIVVDYEEVDARAKAYDRHSFCRWREKEQAAGTYERTMARVYSGWDNLSDDEVQPWTNADEQQIETWLNYEIWFNQ